MNDSPHASARALLGRTLERVGLLGLPLGVGALAGFFAADRGMRLVPTLLGIFLLASAACLLLIVLGRYVAGRAYKVTPELVKLRRRVIVCLALVMIAIVARLAILWSEQPSPLTELPRHQFDQAFAIDAQRYRELDHGLEGAVGFLERQRALFVKDHVLSPDEERRLLDAWVAVYEQAFALDQIRVFYEDWYRFDPSRVERSYHLRSYLLSYAAELALYEKASRLVRLVGANANATKYLDAPHPEQGLPEHSFSRLRQELQGERDQVRVMAGREYLRAIRVGFDAYYEAVGLGVGWLWSGVEADLERVEALGLVDLTLHGLASDLQPLKRAVRHVWFPAQSAVAEWMGDTRTRRIGEYLITDAQLAALDAQLEPGDILLVRKNWYLSNVGLPGFWPHAELYLGAPDKLEAYFDTPEVRDHWRERIEGFTTFSALLAQTHPYHWGLYKHAAAGTPTPVMEAVSEGVQLSDWHHASGDYLVALRPRLDKVAKSQALVEAFRHLGKPYDFDFDFATDHTLVCTELVWRAYRPAEGKSGLEFPLVEVMGRQTFPAHDLARLFAAQHGTAEAQLDFVAFIDAAERERRAFVSTEEAFLETHRRTKWDPFLR